MSFAKITLIGNLGGDPETRFTTNGTQVVNFSVAVNTKREGRDVAEWYRCACFGKLAETAVTLTERGYLVKGKQVYVEGGFTAREYQTKAGDVATSLDVTVRELQLLGQRDDNAGRPNDSGNVDTSEVPF